MHCNAAVCIGTLYGMELFLPTHLEQRLWRISSCSLIDITVLFWFVETLVKGYWTGAIELSFMLLFLVEKKSSGNELAVLSDAENGRVKRCYHHHHMLRLKQRSSANSAYHSELYIDGLQIIFLWSLTYWGNAARCQTHPIFAAICIDEHSDLISRTLPFIFSRHAHAPGPEII